MTLTQEENMTLDLMIANINDELKDALVADDRESDVEILQARYSLLRKLSQLAAPVAQPAEQGERKPTSSAWKTPIFSSLPDWYKKSAVICPSCKNAYLEGGYCNGCGHSSGK